MKMNKFLYYMLMRINKSQLNSLDDEIAMMLVERQMDIADRSLRSIAEENYISQSAVSKFLKKYNTTYKEVQNGSIEMNTVFNQRINSISEEQRKSSPEEIRDDIIFKQTANIEMLKTVDLAQVKHETDELRKYKRVVFIGSDFSMAIINFIQSALLYSGVLCYTMYDFEGQLHMIQRLDENDLVIAISIKGRWFHDNETVIEELFKSKCHKYLWTVMEKHPDEDKFDDVLRIGKPVNEFSYSQLNCFCPLFAHIFLQANNQA